MATKYGTTGDDTIRGGGDNDYFYGLGGNDKLYGNDSADVLTGGAGADILDGGGGAGDTASYYDSPGGVTVDLSTGLGFGSDAESDRLYNIESLDGSSHNDTLTGNDLSNALEGFDGADLLKGGGGTDALYGGNHDDTLKGGGGADHLNGGAGIDTVSYTESPTRVFVSLLTNTAAYGDAEGDTFVYVENITGTPYGDDLWGHDGRNAINGMAGNDHLKGYGGDDTLLGETGDDVIDGGTGFDTMVGGTGSDIYYVDHGYDLVRERGGEGRDVVRTSVDYMLLSGSDVEVLETTDANGTASLMLIGNSNANIIVGNNGANVISGAGGADAMTGLGGSDTYQVDNVNDRVYESGGQGNDRVQTSVSWTITAGSDIELVVTTNESATTALDLTGNTTSNGLRGNAGANVLSGREGADTLVGLGGQDQFLFDTTLGPANVDRVVDFVVADDTIVLDRTIFSSSLGIGNISSGELVIGAAAQDANDRIIYNSGTGGLFYDADGVGGNAQVQFATLGTGLALTNLDFLVIA